MDWIVFGLAIVSFILTTNKNKWGPVVGLIRELTFGLYMLYLGQYGFVAGAVFFSCMFVHRINRWWKDSRRDSPLAQPVEAPDSKPGQ